MALTTGSILNVQKCGCNRGRGYGGSVRWTFITLWALIQTSNECSKCWLDLNTCKWWFGVEQSRRLIAWTSRAGKSRRCRFTYYWPNGCHISRLRSLNRGDNRSWRCTINWERLLNNRRCQWPTFDHRGQGNSITWWGSNGCTAWLLAKMSTRSSVSWCSWNSDIWNRSDCWGYG